MLIPHWAAGVFLDGGLKLLRWIVHVDNAVRVLTLAPQIFGLYDFNEESFLSRFHAVIQTSRASRQHFTFLKIIQEKRSIGHKTTFIVLLISFEGISRA